MDTDATTLSAERLEDLRAQARRSSGGGLIDPRALYRVDRASFHPQWASAVLGRQFPGVRWLHAWEITLLDLALSAEPERPVPAAVAEHRRSVRQELEAAAQRRLDAIEEGRRVWHALRARLPITVSVGHNWTLGHWESGYVTGREHIVVQQDLVRGRLVRKRGQVLCETPSKTRSGRRNKDPLRGVDREDDGQDRTPTCAPCLRLAERIAAPQ